jgi:hypothetical protein
LIVPEARVALQAVEHSAVLLTVSKAPGLVIPDARPATHRSGGSARTNRAALAVSEAALAMLVLLIVVSKA